MFQRWAPLLWLGVACTDASLTDAVVTGTTGSPTGSTTGSDTATAVPLAMRIDMTQVLAHLDALQAIADAQGGHRGALSAGHRRSADYVASELARYGYAARREGFTISQYQADSSAFSALTPEKTTYAGGVDYAVSPYSGNGSATGAVVAVDAVLPPGAKANTSTAGCEASDFATFPFGAIALLQRGTCLFTTKYQNAVAAGASAVVFFNEGQAGRTGIIAPQVGTKALGAVPSIGVTFAIGEVLAAAGGTATITVQGSLQTGSDDNVFAETGGDANRVVMVGAHLDSVAAGPGINDNGSGAAFVLELARLLAEHPDPDRQIRLAFWGAEEIGLVGSAAWLTDPSTGGFDKGKIATLTAYLNFDMMASPNGARFVYDGDGSDTKGGFPPTAANAAVEAVFQDWFALQGEATATVPILLPSDSFWFTQGGVPTGGVFSGASAVKTKAQAATFGGTAGQPLDACYHLTCDERDNVDEVLFESLARAGAHVVETLAFDPAMPGPPPRAAASRELAPRALPAGSCHDHDPEKVTTALSHIR